MANYLNELGIAGADQAEVIQLFLAYYSTGKFTNDRDATFGRVQDETALVVKCNAAGAITSVAPGPHFQNGDVSALRTKIEQDLLTPGPVQITRQILFSQAKTEGFYKSEGQFQIMAVPADSPQPKYSCSDYPSVLEVAFTSSADFGQNVTRGARALSRIELTLIPLLPALVRMQATHGGRVWTQGPSETAFWRQEYDQVGYIVPGGPQEAFSDIAGLSPMAVVPYQEFYKDHQHRYNTFKVPDSLETSLGKIARLSPENHEKYLRAAYWLRQAGLAGPFGNSPSFVALVSAVEALMGAPVRTGTCESCSQPISIGNTALFRNFIDAHTSADTVPTKLKNEFYNMRSNVAHGGSVFRADLEGRGMTLRGSYEQHRFMTLHDLVRIVVYNWLQNVGSREIW
ncbi:hypothetical protein [Asticcacaulis benevestitus]|uniref:Apea-like HEPN domain-containing protein n=1 Tax=Asticcacaulis benevestitus DSM 16100 = ATCC BAA-896 TaxID=1121022 RepID=V4PYL0_9CAUL|nr:hypothetical protein [Asticcacaulis benevestitus]ESQ92529.1 hypothetical protein ABENE_07790 [Asticcacaulis benevestitus DSM 16100 = ATCC BAA-896]